jgi:hypothetical protein
VSVSLFGVRHHGPGSARSVVRALSDLDPDIVLIEGPPECDPLIPLAANPGMRPPVALLVHVKDQPVRATFYPLAVFSPEWQAIRFALDRGVPVRFIDLPTAVMLAEPNPPPSLQGQLLPREEETNGEAATETLARQDPIALLAGAAGYADPERWWEDVVEHSREGGDAFAPIAEAMALARTAVPPRPGTETEREARREAHMRRSIRVAQREGFERIAVVCGAWHVPALAQQVRVASDDALLRGLPKARVLATWVPWSHGRLALASGYGAGVASPGWYHHLFTAPDLVVERWLTRCARLLRERDLPASSAEVIDAVLLSDALAALRGRPLAGLEEVTEATRAVMGFGSEIPMALIHEQLVVGQELGSVPEEAPKIPLQRDLEAEQRRLRLKPEASVRPLDLDLRKPGDLARSHLLHRLRLLGVPWGLPKRGRGASGTFHELWALRWEPDFAVGVIEAGMWGTTILGAAGAFAIDRASKAETLAELTQIAGTCLLADLGDAGREVMRLLGDRAAVEGDTTRLMEALPPLASILRYGNVRATDGSAVREVVCGVTPRICIGLQLALASLDDDAARAMLGLLEGVHGALVMLDEPELRDAWLSALAQLLELTGLHGLIGGRVCRLLLDVGVLSADEAARRMGLALSPGTEPAAGGAWVEGFLRGSALVLLHDEGLLRLVDSWVSGLSGGPFVESLPLLRRTFATYPRPERRQIGERLRRLDGSLPGSAEGEEEFDLDRAEGVLPLVAALLGIEGLPFGPGAHDE